MKSNPPPADQIKAQISFNNEPHSITRNCARRPYRSQSKFYEKPGKHLVNDGISIGLKLLALPPARPAGINTKDTKNIYRKSITNCFPNNHEP